MSATVRRGAVVVLLVFSVACGSSGPTSPTATSPSPTPLPGLTPQPSVTRSRFILYDNGAFSFQYMNPGGSLSGQYRGSYAEENGVIGFSWAGSRYPNASEATGRLEGDSLKVEYNLNMQLSDFENAVYARIP